MTKFLHTSDWHLGMTRRLLDEDAQARFSGSRMEAVRQIAAIAKAEGCEFVVVCGDTFESNQVDRKVVANAIESLKAFEMPVFLLPGNHDSYDAASPYRSKAFESAPPNVHLLADLGPHQVPETDVEILAAPLLTRHPSTDLATSALESIGDSPHDGTRILVAHGVTDNLSPDRNAIDVISLDSLEAALDNGVVTYVALGDRHSATDVGGNGKIRYSGSPVVTDYVDNDANHVLIVEIANGGVSVEARDVGEWQFLTEQFDINNSEDVDAVEAWLEGVERKHLTIAKLGFVGALSLAQRSRLDEIIDRFSELFAALRIRESTTDLVVKPTPDDLSEIGLSGYAAQTLDELAERADAVEPGESDQVANDALSLLYRLAKSS